MSKSKSPDGITEAEIPVPKPGKAFVVYRLKGEKTWRAHVLLSDSHREKNWQTGATEQNVAIAKARHYSRRLAATRGAPSYLELRRQKGEMNSSDKWNANRAAEKAGLPLPFPPGADAPAAEPKKKVGRPFGAKTKTNGHVAALVPIVETPGVQEWPGFIRRHEERCVVFFHRVSELFIAEAHADPAVFVGHLRAMIIESYENSFRKPRARTPGP